MSLNKSVRLVLTLLIVGCTNDTGQPTAPAGPADPIRDANGAVIVTSIRQVRDSILLIHGIPAAITVQVLDSRNGEVRDRIVTWTSSDQSVVQVQGSGTCGLPEGRGCYRTFLYPGAAGMATITATVDGVSASASVRVLENPASGEGSIKVEFEVIEFLDNEYAPLVTVTAAKETAGLEVIAMTFRVPASGRPYSCIGSVKLIPGGTASMFREIYGDYQLTFSIQGGLGAFEAARVSVYTRDANDRLTVTEASAAVVQGTWPSTYTGGTPPNQWACSW